MNVDDALTGVELTAFFAFVGLIAYAFGWSHSSEAASTFTVEDNQELLSLTEGGSATVSINPIPVPEWVWLSLWVVGAVLVVAAVVEIYLTYEQSEQFRSLINVGDTHE